MNITKNTGTVNTSYRANRSIKYIVLHYTASTRSTKGSASNIASYFKSGNAGGSADFIVDDGTIVQYNGDIENRYCWAVGGSKYSKLSSSQGGTHYGKCTNINSISIEMCSNKTNKSSLGAEDTDWYFTEKTIENATELTKYLMEKYNIPISNVIMHHNVTGKICPNPWCVNESRLSKWNEFKSKLEAEDMTEEQVISIATKVSNDMIYKYSDKVYNKIEEVPEWGKATVNKLIGKGILKGDENGLNLSYTLLRLLVINDRAGLYD